MIRQGFILTTAMLLSGCGYHFANQVDAYDLMPRPVTNKRFQIVPPDESIQSRMFSGRFADGLAKKGVIISTHSQIMCSGSESAAHRRTCSIASSFLLG